jgi:hypothetical protein
VALGYDDIVTDDVRENVYDYLTTINRDFVESQISKNTQVLQMPDGRQFQAYIELGEDPTKMLFTANEAGNHFNTQSWLRTAIARQALDGDSTARTIVCLANPQYVNKDSQSILNFSKDERRNPYGALTERALVALDQAAFDRADADDIVYFGASQGSKTVLQIANDGRTPKTPNVISIEPGDTMDRNLIQLALRLFTHSGGLEETKLNNFAGFDNVENDPRFLMTIERAYGKLYMAKIASGFLHPDNLALFAGLCENSFSRELGQVIAARGHVVRARATNGITPDEIGDEFDEYKKLFDGFRSVKVDGTHAITNDWALTYALAQELNKLRAA